MFFYFSKILSGLLFPYSLFFLASLYLFKRIQNIKLKRKLYFLLLCLYLISFYPVSGMLMGLLESRYPDRASIDFPNADAIILAGGMINPFIFNKDLNPEFNGSVDRLIKAQELLRIQKAPLLIISAGSGLLLQKGEKEADLLKKYLVKNGFDSRLIISENKSRNTYENALYSRKIANKRKINKILLVTSAFHMPRSVHCFEAQGFEVIAVPTDYYTYETSLIPEMVFPSPSALRMTTIAIKEYIGITAYYFSGYFRKHHDD